MKLSSFIFLNSLILLLFILPSRVNAQDSAAPDTSWYPLEIGNEWHFYERVVVSGAWFNYYYTYRKVTDTLRFREELFYKIETEEIRLSDVHSDDPKRDTTSFAVFERYDDVTKNVYALDQIIFRGDTLTNVYGGEYLRNSQSEVILLDSLNLAMNLKNSYSEYDTSKIGRVNYIFSLHGDSSTFEGLYLTIDAKKNCIESELSNNETICFSTELYNDRSKNSVNVTQSFDDRFYSYHYRKGIGYIHDNNELKYAKIGEKEYGEPLIPLSNEEHPSDRPSFFKLSSYPNPFNPQTTVEVQTLTAGNYTVEVYDLLGRKLKTLHRGVLSSGSTQFQLNGEGLASGIYLIRAAGEGQVESHRIMLLK